MIATHYSEHDSLIIPRNSANSATAKVFPTSLRIILRTNSEAITVINREPFGVRIFLFYSNNDYHRSQTGHFHRHISNANFDRKKKTTVTVLLVFFFSFSSCHPLSFHPKTPTRGNEGPENKSQIAAVEGFLRVVFVPCWTRFHRCAPSERNILRPSER